MQKGTVLLLSVGTLGLICLASGYSRSTETNGCSEMLRDGVDNFSANANAEPGHDPLGETRVDIITWRLVSDLFRDSIPSSPREHFDASRIPQSEFDFLTTDSLRQLRTARALALLMRGPFGGFMDYQAMAASDIYSHWRLPPAPALLLLTDPKANNRARMYAVNALENNWADSSVGQAAVAVLCGLAAKAEGVQSLTGLSETTKAVQVLNEEDLELLSKVELVFHRAPKSVEYARIILPKQNVLTATFVHDMRFVSR